MFTSLKILVRTCGALAAFIAASPAFAQDPSKLNDLEIAHSAYTADAIDIEYGKIALAKSTNAEVRKFAELMVSDHSAVNEAAGKLLAKLKAEPKDNDFSKALLAGAEKKKAEFAKLEGAAFDKAYAENELGYHQTVNKVLSEAWLPNIKNAEVKEFFVKAAATFKIHEDHASKMVAGLK